MALCYGRFRRDYSPGGFPGCPQSAGVDDLIILCKGIRCWVFVLLSVFACSVSLAENDGEADAPDFRLQFSRTENRAGCSGSPHSSLVDCILLTRGNESDLGAQGWSFGASVQEGTITEFSIEGTQAADIGEAGFELHHILEGGRGVVSVVDLGVSEGRLVTLPANGAAILGRMGIESSFPDGDEERNVQLEYNGRLRTADGAFVPLNIYWGRLRCPPATQAAFYSLSGDAIPPELPDGLRAVVDSGEGTIRLSWEDNDAANYNLWRQVAGGRRVLHREGIIGNVYVDSAVEERIDYTYWVSAVDECGNPSDLSLPVEATLGGGLLAPLLPAGETREVSLGAGADARSTTPFCFQAHREAGAPGNTIVFSLRGQEGDQNYLLLAWGRIPTPQDFDLGADLRGQASQRLVVPYARDENAYILLWAVGNNDGGPNAVTIRAELPALFLQDLSVKSAARGSRVTTSVFGGGFTPATVFRLRGREGEGIVSTTQFISSSHVLLTAQVSEGASLGNYLLEASVAQESVLLRNAFEVVGAAAGILEVKLFAAGQVRPYRPRPLQVHYRNIGSGSLKPRLLRIKPPPEAKLKFQEDSDFLPLGQPLDILTVNLIGYPGSLPPGAAGGKNLVYMIDSIANEEFEFTVETFSPLAADPLCLGQGQNCVETLVRPPSVPEPVWAGLENVLGTTLPECIDALGELSLRLALRGREPASVQEALQLAVHTAWTQIEQNHPSAAVSGLLRNSQGEPLGGARVAAVRGAERGCGQTLPSGFFVIEGLQGGPAAYRLEVEGYEVTAELAIDRGAEGSFGNVVVGAASPGPFDACAPGQNSFRVETPGFPLQRFGLAGEARVEVITPVDPNYKTGPGGQSQGEVDPDGPGGKSPVMAEIILAPPHRTAGATFFYEIVFQNEVQATAAARSVNVLDSLGPLFDPSTVRFLGVGVDADYLCSDGSYGTFTQGNKPFCPGVSPYSSSSSGSSGSTSSLNANFTFPLTADIGISDIHVNVSCTRVGSDLKWEFTSLTEDQSGNLRPIDEDLNVDEFAGFLVAHVPGSPTGEAFVQFSVDLAHPVAPDTWIPGTLIRNKATVDFLDINSMGGRGDGAGAGNPVWSLDTNYTNHLIGRESDWPDGCEFGVDEDLDGDIDCADSDCGSFELCLFLRGDGNSDGVVDISDGIAMLRWLFGTGAEPRCKDAADTNDDGEIVLTDAILIFNYLFLGGNEPDLPGPVNCGTDPNLDDDFGCLHTCD